MSLRRKIQMILSVTVLASTLLAPLSASAAPAHFAQSFDAKCENEKDVNQDNCGIVAYLVLFINVLSALVGVVVVIMIAVGGVQYSMARDNPQATTAAKERIRNAVLALVFYLFAVAFLQWLVPGGVF